MELRWAEEKGRLELQYKLPGGKWKSVPTEPAKHLANRKPHIEAPAQRPTVKWEMLEED
jgi:hypothetical protein